MRRASRRAFIVGGMACLVAACKSRQAGALGYGIAVSGDGNEVTIAPDKNDPHTHIAAIHSEAGIGQASVAWWGATTPHQIVFHLHLSGLEQFSLRWFDQAVNVSVNSTAQTVIQSVQRLRQSESSITPDSPFWMEVGLPESAESIFTLYAPAAFIATVPRFWGIAWVDFYR